MSLRVFRLREDFQAYPPQMVLVQGDTTTAFCRWIGRFL